MRALLMRLSALYAGLVRYSAARTCGTLHHTPNTCMGMHMQQ